MIDQKEREMIWKKKHGYWDRKLYSAPAFNDDIQDNGFTYDKYDRWGDLEPYMGDVPLKETYLTKTWQKAKGPQYPHFVPVQSSYP